MKKTLILIVAIVLVAGFLLRVKTLEVLADETWNIEYQGNTTPDLATPAWELIHLQTQGSASSDGNVLTLMTTNQNAKTECNYVLRNIVNSTKGITVEAKVKIGSIGNDGLLPDTWIVIGDGNKYVKLAFLEDRVFDGMNDSAYSTIDTMTDFHVYRITYVDNAAKLYIDGNYRLPLTTDLDTHNYIYFGDGMGQFGGTNGVSHWDYVKINTEGANAPGLNESWLTQWWFWTIIGLAAIAVVFASTTSHYYRRQSIPKQTRAAQNKLPSETNRVCPKCGANLPGSSKFCGKCGTPLE